MKQLLQSEEVILFGVCLWIFPFFDLSWWWFAALILTPDIGMAGYLINARTGAWTYNLFHHKGMAALAGLAGYLFSMEALLLGGYILFTHACLDRMLGYGLKYEKGFRFTHLGELNASNEKK